MVIARERYANAPPISCDRERAKSQFAIENSG